MSPILLLLVALRTTDITCSKCQIEGLENIPINFFDIWGLDIYNFENKLLFLDVLQGNLPEDYAMRECDD